MIDFNNINKYRENNRIEAKKAQGGLPHSLWATYSSFANTIGGIILLGVEEIEDHSFRTVFLENPERLVSEFWQIIGNTQKVSVNILTDKDVQVIESQGNRIIVIEVPQAHRKDKPVYIGGNPFSGTYRRSGEGDYHCTREEVSNMLRDAGNLSQDVRILKDMNLSVLDMETVDKYRERLISINCKEPAWSSLSPEAFLTKLDASAKGKDGKLHPTAAGLLMFGYVDEIVKVYPDYVLDFMEMIDGERNTVVHISSNSRDWSGNLYEFYIRIYQRILQGIDLPSEVEGEASGQSEFPETPVHEAVQEILVNALVHANYYGKRGLVIKKTKDKLIVANPGGMRINPDAAVRGGFSDPRNTTIMKMFNLINICKSKGQGLSGVYSVWEKEGWEAPKIEEYFNPDRTMLSLKFAKGNNSSGRQESFTTDKAQVVQAMPAEKERSESKKYKQREKILDYLTRNIEGTVREFSALLEIPNEDAGELVDNLVGKGYVVPEGYGQGRRYLLRY